MKYVIKDGSKVILSNMVNGSICSYYGSMDGMYNVIINNNNIISDSLDNKYCQFIMFYESLDEETFSGVVGSVFGDNIEKVI
jgi:hypothetical protein